MCGLLGGVSSTLVGGEIDTVRKLFLLNSFRGEDSTGMVDVVHKKDNKESVIQFWKSTANPIEFVQSSFQKAVKNRWKKNAPRLIMGHCRAATKGDIVRENAHPFVFDHILGMHNGTIHEQFENSKKFKTDSEAIFFNIRHKGVEKALSMVKEGAFALVWLDSKEGTLNFIRNTKRPLHYYNNSATLYWSSEKRHLECALPFSNPNIKEFQPYILYSLDLSKSVVLKETDLTEQLKPKVVTSTYTSYYGGDYGKHHRWPGASNYNSYTGFSDAGLQAERERLENLGITTATLVYNTKDIGVKATNKYFTLFALASLREVRKELNNRKRAKETVVKLKEEGETSDTPFKFFDVLPNRSISYLRLREVLAKGCCACGEKSTNPEAVSFTDFGSKTEIDYFCNDCIDYAIDNEEDPKKAWILQFLTQDEINRQKARFELETTSKNVILLN